MAPPGFVTLPVTVNPSGFQITNLANGHVATLSTGLAVLTQPYRSGEVLRGQIFNQVAQALARPAEGLGFQRTGAIVLFIPRDQHVVVPQPGEVIDKSEVAQEPDFDFFSSSDPAAAQAAFHSEMPLASSVLTVGWQTVLHQDHPNGEVPRPPAGQPADAGHPATAAPSTEGPVRSSSAPASRQNFDVAVREIVHAILGNLQIVLPNLHPAQDLHSVIQTLSEHVAVRLQDAVQQTQASSSPSQAREAIAAVVQNILTSGLVVMARETGPETSRSVPQSAQPFVPQSMDAPATSLRFAQALPPQMAQAVLGRVMQILATQPLTPPHAPMPQQSVNLTAQLAPVMRPQVQSQQRMGEAVVTPQQAQTADKNQGVRREAPVVAQSEAARAEVEKRSQSRVLGTEGQEARLEEEPTVTAARGSALEDATSGDEQQQGRGDDIFEPSWGQIETVLESFGPLGSVEDGARLLRILTAFVPAGRDLIDLLAAIDRRRGWGWAEGSRPVIDAIQQVASYQGRTGATKEEVLFDPLMSLAFLLPRAESGATTLEDPDMEHFNPERMAMHQHLVQMFLDRPGWLERASVSRDELEKQLREAQDLMISPFFAQIFRADSLPSPTTH